MPDRQLNTTTVTVYEGDSAVYAIGTGFVLDFQAMPLGLPEFEIQNGRLEVIVNDTRASVLGPAAFDDIDADQLATEVTLQFYQHGDDIEYVIGMHDPMLPAAADDPNLLDVVYEPFHAIADDGTQYEVRHRFAGSSGDVTGDPILGIEPRDDRCLQVRNTEEGWTVPVSVDRLASLFEDGDLHAVIPVVRC